MYFIPFGVVFAALGLNQVLLIFSQYRVAVQSMVLGAILVLNLYRAQIAVFLQVGHKDITLLLREISEASCDSLQSSCPPVHILVSPQYLFPEQDFYTAAQIFGIHQDRFTISRDIKQICDASEGRYFSVSGDREAKKIARQYCPQAWQQKVVVIKEFVPGGPITELF